MRFWLILSALAVLSSPAAAQDKQQPISKSLAECSVIFKVMRVTAAEKDKPQKQLDGFEKGSEKFLEAAYEEARKEGQAEGYIDGELPLLNEKWHERWISAPDIEILGYMPENMEWAQYCGALGKDRGILPIK